jgi:hypothetical protein
MKKLIGPVLFLVGVALSVLINLLTSGPSIQNWHLRNQGVVLGLALLLTLSGVLLTAIEHLLDRRKPHINSQNGEKYSKPTGSEQFLERLFKAINGFREIEQIIQKSTILTNSLSDEIGSVIHEIKSQSTQNSADKKRKIHTLLDNLSDHLYTCSKIMKGTNTNFERAIRETDEGIWFLLKLQDLSNSDDRKQVIEFLNLLRALESSASISKNLLEQQHIALSEVPKVNQSLNNAINNYTAETQELADHVRQTIEMAWRAQGVGEGLLRTRKQ